MAQKLEELLEQAKGYTMGPDEREEQRRSFAHGNVAIGNPNVTRATIDEAAETLASQPHPQGAPE